MYPTGQKIGINSLENTYFGGQNIFFFDISRNNLFIFEQGGKHFIYFEQNEKDFISIFSSPPPPPPPQLSNGPPLIISYVVVSSRTLLLQLLVGLSRAEKNFPSSCRAVSEASYQIQLRCTVTPVGNQLTGVILCRFVRVNINMHWTAACVAILACFVIGKFEFIYKICIATLELFSSFSV